MRLVFVSLAALLACSAGAATDPLKQFQATVLQRCEAQFAARPLERVRQHSSGDWIHNYTTPFAVTYDVRKTDSLVSPFAAVLKVTWTEQNLRRKTEDEARTATPEGATTVSGYYEVRYAFQNARWVTTDGENSMGFRAPGEYDFRSPTPPVKLTAADLRANPLLRDCTP